MTRTPICTRGMLAVAAAVALAGCQTLSPDGGMGAVAGIAGTELHKEVVALTDDDTAAAARDKIATLLRRPLTADAAVQIALLGNRGLQAAYQQLFATEAAAVEASLPPSPTVTLARLTSPGEVEIERQVLVGILQLATLPARSAIAADRIRQAQLRAAEETLRVAAETRRAFYRAVAARQLAAFLAEAQTSAATASRLAKRLGETGALNKLDQAREHVFTAELTGQLARARRQADIERERLTRLMGLWGADTGFRLPASLPPLPRAKALPQIEQEAMTRRVDLQIARLEVEALAKSLGLTQATRLTNVLELSGIANTRRDTVEGTRTHIRGVEVEFSVPLFDFGAARARGAEATYMQAVHRLAEKAVAARSEAREAYRSYRSANDIARHYRAEVLPLRRIISEEMLLRYNAMVADVFELLAEVRQRVAATSAAIEADRDVWLASTDLAVAVTGGGVAGSAAEASAAAMPAAGGGH